MDGRPDTSLERRSGLPGLGGRPVLHPSWGEGSNRVELAETFSEANKRLEPALGVAQQRETDRA